MGAQVRGSLGERAGLGRCRVAALLATSAIALLATASPAFATFHLIKVREVFAGTTGNPDSGYVELQMYSAGQNLVQFGELEVLNSAGTVTSQFKPSSSVAKSVNQSTVLIVDTGFGTQFPGVTPDFTDSALNLSPAGGAVCWPQTEPPFDDCASWGNFTGQASLPSPGDLAPAVPSGIPSGMALRRTISPGCSTLLENSDDANNSSVDFSLQSPEPRSNATTPSEHECPALPNTAIDSKPANPTKATSASFTYHAIPAAEATFECRLDAASFAACAAIGIEYAGPLAQGSHSFEVRAVGPGGTDSTPAAFTWTVDTTPPTATIQSHPADPSSGASATFKYQSSEVGSKFECSLASAGGPASFSSCPSTGKTYPGLTDGDYSFEVRAIDAALNQGSAASFSWTIDNSLADTTPPETTILSRPPDPSDSSTASFSFESNEPGSSFECSLDGGAFAPCPATGVTYAGLGNGPHTFQVRAIDASGNVDQTPAGYSFQVVLTAAVAPSPPFPPSAPRPTAPETAFSGKPSAKTHDRTPTFRFRASAPGATFQCKLDGAPFKPCRSPLTTRKLAPGRHTLQVRAVFAGLADPSAATIRFKVMGGGK